ncbi:hypothetical protein M0804_013922 [Polistes exclamans]|nr:hypothetical protein M0804_013927 [Polistes exclamans]KAI4476030.1 hypothetical protein M0804_013922 [Polistes exclamans]
MDSRNLDSKWIFSIRETYPEGKFSKRSDAGHPDSGALKAGARRTLDRFGYEVIACPVGRYEMKLSQ